MMPSSQHQMCGRILERLHAAGAHQSVRFATDVVYSYCDRESKLLQAHGKEAPVREHAISPETSFELASTNISFA